MSAALLPKGGARSRPTSATALWGLIGACLIAALSLSAIGMSGSIFTSGAIRVVKTTGTSSCWRWWRWP